MEIPGIAAITTVITSDCRRGRGDTGAIDEALARVKEEMLATIPNWPVERDATFFLVFTVDRKGRRTLG